MRRLVVLVIATNLASGCETEASKRSIMVACPPVVHYHADLQEIAAAEVETLPEGLAVAALLIDYAVMRDQARACETAEGSRAKSAGSFPLQAS